MKIKLIVKIKDVILGYACEPGKEITIGREIGNTIAPLVDNLSRHHAKIYAKGDVWFAEDLGSTNGSYVNGDKLTGAKQLSANDQLRFGLVDITVNFVPESAAEAAQAVKVDAAVPPPVLDKVTDAELKPITPEENAAAAKPAPAAKSAGPLSPISPIKPGLRPGLKLPPRPVIKLPPKKA